MLNKFLSLSLLQRRLVVFGFDALFIVVAALCALLLVDVASDTATVAGSYLFVLPYVVMSGVLASWAAGLNEMRIQHTETGAAWPTALVAGTLVFASAGFCTLVGLTYPVALHIVLGMGYFLFSVVGRMALFQLVMLVYRTSQNRTRILIYGAGSTGKQLALALRHHKSLEPVAFVDDNVTLQNLKIARLPVLSPLRIEDLVHDLGIGRVLLAASSMAQAKQTQVVKKLDTMGVEVQTLPSFAQLIGEIPLIDKLKPASARVLLGRDEINESWQLTRNCYKDRVILITGAGGSIGSELCRQVLQLGPSKLVLFELSEFALYTVLQEMEALADGLGIEVVGVLGSVTEVRQVRRVMQHHKIDVVLHTAAYKHVPIVENNPLSGLVNNVLGTQTLVQQSIQANVERFILISSDKAVRPTNIMGASKRLAECVLHDADFQVAPQNMPIFSTVRFGNVLGSSGSVVPLFEEQLSRGGPITVTDPRMMRYFMTVQEAVRLVLRSGSIAEGGETFVLDMGDPLSIKQLARQVIENAGYSVRDASNPSGDIEISITGARRGEKLVEELTLGSDLRATDHPKIFASHEDKPQHNEIAQVLRKLREALVASDEDMAREIAMAFVETDTQPTQTGSDMHSKTA
ncbi:MAG: nucleoside-diphosphate sugar epimerase/dehydratase [Roseobacter sp.]